MLADNPAFAALLARLSGASSPPPTTALSLGVLHRFVQMHEVHTAEAARTAVNGQERASAVTFKNDDRSTSGTRPAIANERFKRNDAGDVVLQLKSAWRDGTTHIKMSPLEFMRFGPMNGSNGHREWEFSVNTTPLTASWASHIVADSEKRRLIFVFSEARESGGDRDRVLARANLPDRDDEMGNMNLMDIV